MTLRIAILAHSTNPRGGVVHAMALAEALVDLGHEAVLHAPDPTGRGFFRKLRAGAIGIPASLAHGTLADLVEVRAADYVRWFESPANRRFDLFHAQDGISANALATLKERGLIAGFARTVHHVDTFDDPRLQRLQIRAIRAADRHFVVSRHWREALKTEHGIVADVVGNGVDRAHFSPAPQPADRAVRARYGLTGPGPFLLAVGGVEARKNTLQILNAFALVRQSQPTARLVIAGGASLLDHGAYQAAFADRLARLDLPERAVVRTGPVDDDVLPAFYRIADALLFPSVNEGFGLVVLEAMASGLPVVTSRIEPFTEYLGEHDVAWCDPADAGSIAAASHLALDPYRGPGFAARGLQVAGRHGWAAVARAHEPAYASLAKVCPEVCHA